MASSGAHQTYGRPGGGRRPSAAVYRRRRLAAAVLLLLVIAALAVGAAFLTGALGRGGPAADQSAQAATEAPTDTASDGQATAPPATAPPTANPTAEPTPAPTGTPGADASAPAESPAPTPAGCADSVVVVAETNQPSYASGEDPVLSLVVRNEGDTPCEVNVGTSQMEFVVTNDDERVFSSVDCQTDSQDLPLTVEPGGEERATFDWGRNRTVPECTVVEEQPVPGEYTLTTRLGARSSSPVEFTLQ